MGTTAGEYMVLPPFFIIIVDFLDYVWLFVLLK
jgi:hypothetical protein